jgi:hypothetical protein
MSRLDVSEADLSLELPPDGEPQRRRATHPTALEVANDQQEIQSSEIVQADPEVAEAGALGEPK